jgi:dethiobiotin synthetase
MKRLFVTGIGTDVGKTVVAAVLAKAWGMDYWKPVQAGELAYTDSDKVREWTNGRIEIHSEAYRLTEAMSPHAAARRDGVRIALEDLKAPLHEAPLLIEGAGGLLVPINDEGDTMLDLAASLQAELLLVSRNFLGSINQTLLSAEVLSQRGLPVRGIIFSGVENEESERIIERMTELPVLARLEEETPGAGMVERNARRFAELSPFRSEG